MGSAGRFVKRELPAGGGNAPPQLTTTYLVDTTQQQVESPEDEAEGKVVISGDDILIEYCERVKHALKQIPDVKLRPAQQAQLIRFITHYVWQLPDKVNLGAGKGP